VAVEARGIEIVEEKRKIVNDRIGVETAAMEKVRRAQVDIPNQSEGGVTAIGSVIGGENENVVAWALKISSHGLILKARTREQGTAGLVLEVKVEMTA